MTGMGWRTTGDVAEFLAVAGEYLREERARNTVILTVSEQLRLNPARYAQPAGGDAAAGDAAAGPAGFRCLAGGPTRRARSAGRSCTRRRIRSCSPPSRPPPPPALAADPGRPPAGGVNGYAEAAEAFAATWLAATPGGQATEERRLRLYRLGELAWPDPAPDGAPRVAADRDAPLLADWFTRVRRGGR